MSLFLHGDAYAFWSGVGNDVPVYLIGAVPMWLVWFKKNKCHHPHCYCLGHHPYKHYQYCKKHHPLEINTKKPEQL